MPDGMHASDTGHRHRPVPNHPVAQRSRARMSAKLGFADGTSRRLRNAKRSLEKVGVQAELGHEQKCSMSWLAAATP
jgi:hypothetical protein